MFPLSTVIDLQLQGKRLSDSQLLDAIHMGRVIQLAYEDKSDEERAALTTYFMERNKIPLTTKDMVGMADLYCSQDVLAGLLKLAVNSNVNVWGSYFLSTLVPRHFLRGACQFDPEFLASLLPDVESLSEKLRGLRPWKKEESMAQENHAFLEQGYFSLLQPQDETLRPSVEGFRSWVLSDTYSAALFLIDRSDPYYLLHDLKTTIEKREKVKEIKGRQISLGKECRFINTTNSLAFKEAEEARKGHL